MGDDSGLLLAALRERLRIELAGGLDLLPRAVVRAAPVAGPVRGRPASPGPGAKAAPPPARGEPSGPGTARLAIHPPPDTPLGKVCAEALGCVRCKLSRTRTQVVFGVGNPASPLLFVGEAPGADEDAQGEPFVGRAGQLLTRLLKEVGIARQDVYIANVLKCRPPGNRPPEADEVAQCGDWLRQQLRIMRPKVVCALGNPALRWFLGGTAGITKMRGRFFPKDDYLVFPTFHPAYLLRTPGDMHLAQKDFQNLAENVRGFLKGSGPSDRPSR